MLNANVPARQARLEGAAAAAAPRLAGGAPPRPATTQQRQHQQPQPPQQQQLQRPQQQLLSTLSRRQLLASAVALSAVPAAVQPARAAAGAAGGACELQTSASGLRWCDLAVGDGALPIQGAFTKAHYTAKLASSGAVFDSSYQRRTPLIFKVGEHEVIEAFDVAMLGADDIPPMREGGKRLIVAPPGPLQRQGTKSLVWMVGMLDALEDAGELSSDGTPTSDLVFEVELLAKRRK